MAYCAGLTPKEFYDCTIEEVLRVIRGKVLEWRIQRMFAKLTHESLVEKPGNIMDLCPLPYDDELEEDEVDDIALYNEAVKGLV